MMDLPPLIKFLNKQEENGGIVDLKVFLHQTLSKAQYRGKTVFIDVWVVSQSAVVKDSTIEETKSIYNNNIMMISLSKDYTSLVSIRNRHRDPSKLPAGLDRLFR
jgi:hypothetical protein